MTMTNAVVLIEADRDALSTLGGELAGIEGVAEAYSVTGGCGAPGARAGAGAGTRERPLLTQRGGALQLQLPRPVSGAAGCGGVREGRALGPRWDARGLVRGRPAAPGALCGVALGRAARVRLEPDSRVGGALPELRAAR